MIDGGAVFPHRHLTGIEGLAPHEIAFLLDEAEHWVDANRSHAAADKRLGGLTQINAFFENSTRTLLSSRSRASGWAPTWSTCTSRSPA